YRTARFGIRSFAEGVRDGWATRDRAAAYGERWSRTAWTAARRRFRRRPRTQFTIDPDPPPDPEPDPDHEAPPGNGVPPEHEPAPSGPDTEPPLVVIDGEFVTDETGPDPDLIVDFIQPEPSDIDGLTPAAAAFRPHTTNQPGGTMTVPQPTVGVGEITGIESTRIQLAAVSRVLAAASEALEHMQAGLAEYEVDQKTLGDVAQLVDQVQAASSAASGTVTNLNARHGGVEEAVKSAPVRAAQTRYYEE
ncbi:MAG: hypothetical protein ACRDTM_12835, partial [Micromonosporaceae bacterium]